MISIGKFDILGHSHTVLCDLGSAELTVENYITTLRSKSDGDCVCEHIATLQHEGSGLVTILDLFAYITIM